MRILKKVFRLGRDILEVYFPSVTFVLMFILFLVQVFCRYVIRSPLNWSMEAISMLFLWTVLIGASYAFRTDRHIRFTLFYDNMPRKMGELTTFIGNLIILVLMILSFKPSLEFVDFMKMQSSSVMRISMKVIYAPYMLFLVLSIVYTIDEMIKELRIIFGKEPPETQQPESQDLNEREMKTK